MCSTDFSCFKLFFEDGTPKNKDLLLSVCVYMLCVCVCGGGASQQACGELYSKLCYIGKPEKLPFQRVGTLKREDRFPLSG